MEKGREIDLVDVLIWLWTKRIYWLVLGILFFVAGVFVYGLRISRSHTHLDADYVVSSKYFLMSGRYAGLVYPPDEILNGAIETAFRKDEKDGKVVNYSVKIEPSKRGYGRVVLFNVYLKASSEQEALSLFKERINRLETILSQPFAQMSGNITSFYRSRGEELSLWLKEARKFAPGLPSESYQGILARVFPCISSAPFLLWKTELKVSKYVPQKATLHLSRKVLLKWILISVFMGLLGAFLGIAVAGIVDLIREARQRLASQGL